MGADQLETERLGNCRVPRLIPNNLLNGSAAWSWQLAWLFGRLLARRLVATTGAHSVGLAAPLEMERDPLHAAFSEKGTAARSWLLSHHRPEREVGPPGRL